MTSTELDELETILAKMMLAHEKQRSAKPITIREFLKPSIQAIEAYVAQRVNETLADCYADGLINARTRAAFKSVNNKMRGENA